MNAYQYIQKLVHAAELSVRQRQRVEIDTPPQPLESRGYVIPFAVAPWSPAQQAEQGVIYWDDMPPPWAKSPVALVSLALGGTGLPEPLEGLRRATRDFLARAERLARIAHALRRRPPELPPSLIDLARISAPVTARALARVAYHAYRAWQIGERDEEDDLEFSLTLIAIAHQAKAAAKAEGIVKGHEGLGCYIEVAAQSWGLESPASLWWDLMRAEGLEPILPALREEDLRGLATGAITVAAVLTPWPGT